MVIRSRFLLLELRKISIGFKLYFLFLLDLRRLVIDIGPHSWL